MTTANESKYSCEQCPIVVVARMCREVGTTLQEALPEAFWAHHRAARVERLLALRSLVDAAIDRVEKKPKKVTKIKVGQKA